MSPSVRKRRPYAARAPMAERREQLLDAALTIIDRDGYDKVTIDAIAREAGVTRPVVYGAYDGLGALLLALLDRQQARALAQLYAALPTELLGGIDDVDVPDLIEQAARSLHQMILDDPTTWRVILTLPAGMPDAVRDRVSGDREQVRGVFEGFLRTPATRGQIDGEVLSHALLAALEHFGRLVLLDPEHFDADRLANAARAVARWGS